MRLCLASVALWRCGVVAVWCYHLAGRPEREECASANFQPASNSSVQQLRRSTSRALLLPCRCQLCAICWVLGIRCTLRDFTNLPYHCPIARPAGQHCWRSASRALMHCHCLRDFPNLPYHRDPLSPSSSSEGTGNATQDATQPLGQETLGNAGAM